MVQVVAAATCRVVLQRCVAPVNECMVRTSAITLAHSLYLAPSSSCGRDSKNSLISGMVAVRKSNSDTISPSSAPCTQPTVYRNQWVLWCCPRPDMAAMGRSSSSSRYPWGSSKRSWQVVGSRCGSAVCGAQKSRSVPELPRLHLLQ